VGFEAGIEQTVGWMRVGVNGVAKRFKKKAGHSGGKGERPACDRLGKKCLCLGKKKWRGRTGHSHYLREEKGLAMLANAG